MNRLGSGFLEYNKTLLFIGGPPDALPAIGKAFALGYTPFVVDFDITCPGIKWAKKYSQPYSLASTYDVDGILKSVFETGLPIDGVLAVACDVAPIVSQVAVTLGCPYIPVRITKLSWDKLALKRRLPVQLVPGPALDQSGMIVIKPPDSRGGRGVTVYDPHHQNGISKKTMLSEAFRKARQASPSNRAMTEEYVAGDQVSAESLVWDGLAVFTGLTDRDYSTSLVIERGGWGPSKHDDDPRIRAVCQRVISCLEIKSGSIKFDLVVSEERVVVIEAAIGRLSGGYSCTHYLPLSYGIDFLAAAFSIYCGDEPDLSVKRFPLRCRGWYTSAESAKQHNERGKFRLAISRYG